jgi:hypothetical protein
MVALTLGALEACTHASGMRESSSIARVILYSRSPQPVEGPGTCVSSPPSCGEVGSGAV